MKILLQETPTCRIVQKSNFILWHIVRQRKTWYGWKNVASLCTGQYDTIDEYQQYFNWYEFERKDYKTCSHDFGTGKQF